MCDTRNDACSLFTAQASLSIVRMNAIYALNLDLKNLLTIRFLSHRSFFSHSRGIASKMPAHSDMNKSHSLLYGFIFFVFWFWANGWFIALQNWKPITNFRFRLNPSCVFFSSSSHLLCPYRIRLEKRAKKITRNEHLMTPATATATPITIARPIPKKDPILFSFRQSKETSQKSPRNSVKMKLNKSEIRINGIVRNGIETFSTPASFDSPTENRLRNNNSININNDDAIPLPFYLFVSSFQYCQCLHGYSFWDYFTKCEYKESTKYMRIFLSYFRRACFLFHFGSMPWKSYPISVFKWILLFAKLSVCAFIVNFHTCECAVECVIPTEWVNETKNWNCRYIDRKFYNLRCNSFGIGNWRVVGVSLHSIELVVVCVSTIPHGTKNEHEQNLWFVKMPSKSRDYNWQADSNNSTCNSMAVCVCDRIVYFSSVCKIIFLRWRENLKLLLLRHFLFT